MSYQIDVSRTLWRVTFLESLTNSDFLELSRRVQTLCQGGPFSGLIDLRGISHSDVSFNVLSVFTSGVPDFPLTNEMKIAIIAAAPFQYGYSRMFQTLLEHQKMEIEIFKDEVAALEWLTNNTR